MWFALGLLSFYYNFNCSSMSYFHFSVSCCFTLFRLCKNRSGEILLNLVELIHFCVYLCVDVRNNHQILVWTQNYFSWTGHFKWMNFFRKFSFSSNDFSMKFSFCLLLPLHLSIMFSFQVIFVVIVAITVVVVIVVVDLHFLHLKYFEALHCPMA